MASIRFRNKLYQVQIRLKNKSLAKSFECNQGLQTKPVSTRVRAGLSTCRRRSTRDRGAPRRARGGIPPATVPGRPRDPAARRSRPCRAPAAGTRPAACVCRAGRRSRGSRRRGCTPAPWPRKRPRRTPRRSSRPRDPAPR